MSEFYQIIFAIVLVSITIFVFLKLQKNFTRLEHWAQHHNLNYKKGYSRTLRAERFSKNKGKTFFQSRSIKSNFDTAPSVEGIFNGRQFWLYGIVGIYPFNKVSEPSKNNNDRRQNFFGWGMEFKTQNIPVSMIVRRSYLGGQDEVDIESVNFEKLYHIDVYEGRGTLQLLDPMMIQFIMDSEIAAFEFSDSSVVLYHTLHKPKRDQLDNMLKVGLKVAEQVDRNFPLGKYS